MNESEGLALFHPLIQKWFRERLGTPTDVQEAAWPAIAAGEHVLATAPTGSGKTLTAFLWAIDRLVTGAWPVGHTSVLYVSPMRALNNDIQRNLTAPLSELRAEFEAAGELFPQIRAMTRSGDTPQSERRRMLSRPPEILITTPESLNILHSSLGGQSMLTGIRTVILDEIHAVVGSKRGTHLITAIERLVPACGEFQRIALSATVRPLEKVAEFVGGYSRQPQPGSEPRYLPRPVSILRSGAAKVYDIKVRFPEEAADIEPGDSLWDPLVEEFRKIIDRHQSTLLFVNNRRLCEKLTLLINSGYEHGVAYAHHGSLSRELREEVEGKLKGGELKAIVATNSLELGIDIGALDAVILVQSPQSVSSAIQRLGRAGHQVGEVSRGVLFPTFPHDFLEAAVLSAGIQKQDIEAIQPIDCPLDVLAQIVVSMVGVQTRDREELYGELRTSYPYRNLGREQFDLVLNMLAGRYAHSRIRELRPKISLDGVDGTVVGRKGAIQELYLSGGTIPDRSYFNLRHEKTNARIGDLDEEFVWEHSEGQSFTLGTQNWTIQRITHNDVFVTPAPAKPVDLPFWKADGGDRDFHFSERITQFLEEADSRLEDPGFAAGLAEERAMDASSIEMLLSFLRRQREVTGCALPHRHHIVVERTSSGPGGYPGNQVILHTLWGGRVNRPYALALDAAWEERFGQRLEVFPSNDCICVLLPHDLDAEELLAMVTSSRFEALLKERLESSGFFGARFRECAQRALLLTRNRFNERMPLWMSRLRSQKLLDSVSRFEDFPILLEAWRTCLRDEFDVAATRQLLSELESGAIRWTEVRTTQPSPLARGVSFSQISKYMYMDDQPKSRSSSSLREGLLRDVVFTPGLRPAVQPQLCRQFEEKRQRLTPGYAPTALRDLVDWVVERQVLPETEWVILLEAITRDGDSEDDILQEEGSRRLVRLRPEGPGPTLICALEQTARLCRALESGGVHVAVEDIRGADAVGPSPEPAVDTGDGTDEFELSAFLTEWLQFYGPISSDQVRDSLGLDTALLRCAIDDLLETGQLVAGQLAAGSEEEFICDSQNLESLLRIARAQAIPVFEPRSSAELPLFLATWQCLVSVDDGGEERLSRAVEQLLCYEAPAALWEAEILPARVASFAPNQLDALMGETPLRWIGRGEGRITLCFEPDLDLLDETDDASGEEGEKQREDDATELFADPEARYDFQTLQRISRLPASELSNRLWNGAWNGRLTNDTLTALHKGIETRFQVEESSVGERGHMGSRASSPRPSRSAFARWRGSLPYAGNWHLLATPTATGDLMETEERGKDRARVLLERYGLLFRELLQRETPTLRWGSVFRSLRLMELSGEVLAGCFFEEIPGPQFISHRAFRTLQREPSHAVFWISAVDPISPCGLPLPTLRAELPHRVAANHLIYHGSRLVVVSNRNGKALKINVPHDDPELVRYIGYLRHLLERPFQSVRQLTVETINDREAARTDYVDAFRTCFDVRLNHTEVILCKRPADI